MKYRQEQEKYWPLGLLSAGQTKDLGNELGAVLNIYTFTSIRINNKYKDI